MTNLLVSCASLKFRRLRYEPMIYFKKDILKIMVNILMFNTIIEHQDVHQNFQFNFSIFKINYCYSNNVHKIHLYIRVW